MRSYISQHMGPFSRPTTGPGCFNPGSRQATWSRFGLFPFRLNEGSAYPNVMLCNGMMAIPSVDYKVPGAVWHSQAQPAPDATGRPEIQSLQAPGTARDDTYSCCLRGGRFTPCDLCYSRRVRGSPKWGKRRVMAEIWSPSSVSTISPWACAIGARGSWR